MNFTNSYVPFAHLKCGKILPHLCNLVALEVLIVNNEPASSHDTYNNPTRRNIKYNMTTVVEESDFESDFERDEEESDDEIDDEEEGGLLVRRTLVYHARCQILSGWHETCRI